MVSPLSSCNRRLRDHFGNSASAVSLSSTADDSLAHWLHHEAYSYSHGCVAIYLFIDGWHCTLGPDNGNQITVQILLGNVIDGPQVVIGSRLGLLFTSKCLFTPTTVGDHQPTNQASQQSTSTGATLRNTEPTTIWICTLIGHKQSHTSPRRACSLIAV